MKKQTYIYDEGTMSFVPHKPKRRFPLIFLVLFVLWFPLTSLFQPDVIINTTENIILEETKDEYYKDSVFREYRERADLYLNRKLFEGTPLSGEMLSYVAREVYDSTGILVPLELALAQGQIESGMGRYGRSPKNNPYNVGEFDTKTVKWFDRTVDGVKAYYYLLSNTYLQCRTIDELLYDFKNCSGNNYATKEGYSYSIYKQYNYIKLWIDNNIGNTQQPV